MTPHAAYLTHSAEPTFEVELKSLFQEILTKEKLYIKYQLGGFFFFQHLFHLFLEGWEESDLQLPQRLGVPRGEDCHDNTCSLPPWCHQACKR